MFQPSYNSQVNETQRLEKELRDKLEEIGIHKGWAREDIEKYKYIRNLTSPAGIARVNELYNEIQQEKLNLNKAKEQHNANSQEEALFFYITRGNETKLSKIPVNHPASSILMDGANFVSIDPNDTPFGNVVLISEELSRKENEEKLKLEKEQKKLEDKLKKEEQIKTLTSKQISIPTPKR